MHSNTRTRWPQWSSGGRAKMLPRRRRAALIIGTEEKMGHPHHAVRGAAKMTSKRRNFPRPSKGFSLPPLVWG